MTGYQKLKLEIKILWAELEATVKLYYEGSEKAEKYVKAYLKDLKWAIRRAQDEDKD